MVEQKYDYSKCLSQYEALKTENSEWVQEWRQISEYLLPGRGIYQFYSKPRKRRLTSPRVINPIAEDSLYVLTSGMHGALTSPSRPWFDLEWSDPKLNEVEPLKAWLEDSTERLHTALQRSNFYSIINSFYIEYAGFGTACTYVGEDSNSDDTPFRFELLTAGEYFYSLGADAKADAFFRTIFMTPAQLHDKFPETCSQWIKDSVKQNDTGIYNKYVTVLECIYRDTYKGEFEDKPYRQLYYEIISKGSRTGSPVNSYAGAKSISKEPLGEAGFYEFPYPFARWGTIGSDQLGIGPGSRALPHIKRLQEMEKALLMAAHKSIDPPVNAPGRMKGKLNTLPGGRNWYANPNEKVEALYQMRFDFPAVGTVIERVENTIEKVFFNDVFLTGSRDPNASPLRTGQVQVQEQEKMLRLGPVVERLGFEYFMPMIDRTFNIMLRKDLFMSLSPEYVQLVEQSGGYNTALISPLATAQRSVALQGINSFLGFVGQAAQIDQSVLDNVDVDFAAREYGDITGVNLGILRPKDDVTKIRSDRAEAQQKAEAQQQAIVAAQAGSQMNSERASAAKDQADAGATMIESQQIVEEMGII